MLRGRSQRKKRFDLLLLQEGEIYFEDFASSLFTTSRQRVPGRLHFCSHSLIFVPDETRYAIMMFAFENMLQLRAEAAHADGMPTRYTPPLLHEHVFQPHSRDSIFQLTVTQIVEMKKAGRNHPYIFRKRDPSPILFGLMFISAEDFLARLQPVMDIWRRAVGTNGLIHRSKINAQLRKLYLAQQRSFSFDITWLEDFREQKLFEATGCRVLPLVDIQGRILLTNERIYFQPFNSIGSKPVKKWNLADAKRVVKRRHLLRQTGIEVFFSDYSIFLSFQSIEDRDRVFLLIMKQPALMNVQANEQVNVTELWQAGHISNFDYLMYLNFMADRTFNDLTQFRICSCFVQYPVLPWVVADYASSRLDLDDASTFRDLSKPIGALNPKRLHRFLERFEDMPDPKFMYGTHYSTPGYVLFYLIRYAPEYMLRLQGGRFDDPDRMFFSISETWNSVLHNDSDVKELIPEFYHGTGEFLINSERLNLGTRHDGKKVNDVHLPAWASDEKDFVYKCRLALESEYVSSHLHEWIDLIFGYKQRGPEAVKANNVFYYLTYEGAIDIEKIEDPVERNAYEMQIREFGQTPTQLFTSPHPPKRATLTSPPSFESVTSSNAISLDAIYSKLVSLRNSFRNATVPVEMTGSSSGGIHRRQSEDIDDLQSRLAVTPVPHFDDADTASVHTEDGIQQGPAAQSQSALDDVLAHLGLGPDEHLLSFSSISKNGAQDDSRTNGDHGSCDGSDSFIGAHARPRGDFHAAPQVSSHARPVLSSEYMRNFSKLHSTSLHRDMIASIAFSAYDEICTASHDATAKIFSLSTERQLRRISDLGDTVLSSCVCLGEEHDSKILAVSSWNNRIYLYSVDYGSVVDTLCGHEDAVSGLALHGRNLLSGSWDSTVKLWKVSGTGIHGVPVASFAEHDTEVQCVAFESEQGNLAASGSKEGDVALYDLRMGQAISHFTNHYNSVRDISFLDASTVVTCSKDNSVKVCTVDGSVVHSFTSCEPIHCMVTDGNTVLTGGGSSNGVLLLWAIDTGELLHTIEADKGSPITAMALRRDGTVVTGSKEGVVAWFGRCQ